jgi:hypothetical protein
MRTTVLATWAVVLLIPPFTAPSAKAVISTVRTIDGPSPDVLDVGGIAMAEDGTGGVVYRKRVAGRAHVYASQTVGGRWLEPQRVDTGQRFDSSWPRIAAADGGKLVVTWVQEFGVESDRLFSATLDPGASRFQAPAPIDLDVGEATATFPSLAMNRSGAAYIAYRVLTSSGGATGAPPGYVDAETRIARYSGTYWSLLGSVADRNPAVPVAAPTAANSPKIGIDVSGNAIVAFQEPDDEFVDRVWARRIFGATLGIPLIVSPQQFGGAPLRGPADAFSLDVTGFGEGAVALRQQPAPGSLLDGAHVFVNTIPEAFAQGADRFGTPRLADGTIGARLPSAPTTPSAAVTSDGAFSVMFGLGASAMLVNGGDTSVDPPVRLGDGRGAVEAEPGVTVADSGAAVAAWRARTSVVAVQEQPVEGKPGLRGVWAAAGGPVGDLLVTGSGLGDGLVAFRQGTSDAAQIGAAIVDAPPLDFAVQTPIKFVRSKRPHITWDAAENALSPVTYAVLVDRRIVARGLGGRGLRIRKRLRDGRHVVKIAATDRAGQSTTSQPATLKLDRRAPRVRLRVRGRRVAVRVVDGRPRRSSGVSRSKTAIVFGDGRRSRRTASTRHTYKKAGIYRIVVKTRDRAGNAMRLKRSVRVR